MEESFLNVTIDKRIFTAIDTLSGKKYTFVKHHTNRDILKKYNLSDNYIDTRSIVNEWINLDDTIQTVLHKIGIHCCKTTGDYIYAMYKNKPLAFSYNNSIKIDKLDKDTSPDDTFIYNGEFNSGIPIVTRYNDLLETIRDIDDTIYFISLHDFMKINEPSDMSLYFNGIIRKYWVNITNTKMLTESITKKLKCNTKNIRSYLRTNGIS